MIRMGNPSTFNALCVGTSQRLRKTFFLQPIIHVLDDQLLISSQVLFPMFLRMSMFHRLVSQFLVEDICYPASTVGSCR